MSRAIARIRGRLAVRGATCWRRISTGTGRPLGRTQVGGSRSGRRPCRSAQGRGIAARRSGAASGSPRCSSIGDADEIRRPVARAARLRPGSRRRSGPVADRASGSASPVASSRRLNRTPSRNSRAFSIAAAARAARFSAKATSSGSNRRPDSPSTRVRTPSDPARPRSAARRCTSAGRERPEHLAMPVVARGGVDLLGRDVGDVLGSCPSRRIAAAPVGESGSGGYSLLTTGSRARPCPGRDGRPRSGAGRPSSSASWTTHQSANVRDGEIGDALDRLLVVERRGEDLGRPGEERLALLGARPAR